MCFCLVSVLLLRNASNNDCNILILFHQFFSVFTICVGFSSNATRIFDKLKHLNSQTTYKTEMDELNKKRATRTITHNAT